MQSGPVGLTAKLVLPGSASCTARIDQDDLAESFQEQNPSQQEKVKGGRCSAPLRPDPRQQQKLNEPFKERGRSADTSVQMPGSGWQGPGLRRGTSALPALCKGSQEFRTPYKAVAAASWCGQELSAHLGRTSGFAGRAHLHVLRVVLETLDDISDRFAFVADLIHSCEEGEPVGR